MGCQRSFTRPLYGWLAGVFGVVSTFAVGGYGATPQAGSSEGGNKTAVTASNSTADHLQPSSKKKPRPGLDGMKSAKLSAGARPAGGLVETTRSVQGGANDFCETPDVALDGPNPYSTIGNSTDGLPHVDICEFDGQTYHDDWFVYQSTCTGDLTVSTCSTADYDTDLVVYNGQQPDDWTCPPGDAEMLGCLDDTPGCEGFTTELTVPVTTGSFYTIRVGGWMDGDQGTGTLTLTCDFCGDGVIGPNEQCDPPGSVCDNEGVCQPDCTCPGLGENDACEASIAIFDGPTAFTTVDAETDGLPTNCSADCCAFGDPQIHNDIWYDYTATCTGEVSVSTCATVNYDSKIAIYDGCDPGGCPYGGNEIGCNDDGPDCPGFTTIATALVNMGNCYKIRIGGFSADDAGLGTVNISCEELADCGDGLCEDPENECTCPADCPGECPCTLFTDQAEFEAFNEGDGKVNKGIETFEEATTGPGEVNAMDDPLCGGIPNLPDGNSFPNGLDQGNLCLQSNLDHAPATPNPRGVGGLVSVGAGFQGTASGIVIANTFVDSLDLIFSGGSKTGVGFDTLALQGGTSVEIQVFDESNNLLVSATSPASPTGADFFGLWCADGIGRINIFDPGGGSEGGDNIQMWIDPTCEPDCPPDSVCLLGTCCGDGLVEGFEECDPPGTGGGCALPNDCLPDCTCLARGACCESDGPGSCAPLTTPEECAALEGNYLGDGSSCDDCPHPACIGAEGDCYLPHPGVGCDDEDCCAAICAADPICCEEGWDDVCASSAPVICGPLPIENDVCVNPGQIFDGPTDYLTFGANTDGLPHAGVCLFDGQTYHDIWYDYTATCTGDLTLSTCQEDGGDALYDTDLVIYDGCLPEVPCPPETEFMLGCNDDAAETCTAAGTDFASRLTVPVTEDNCYKVRIGGWNPGDQGFATIHLACVGEDACGDCPTDVDGSGATGAFDLAFLLGNWGPVTPDSACLDADGDGIIGPFDLATLLGGWGPCL